MNSGKGYLLGKIVNNKTNGLKSLGDLHAKHIEDLSKVLEDYAAETVIDVVKRLEAGETIKVNGLILSLTQE